jgi:hypothetical protein
VLASTFHGTAIVEAKGLRETRSRACVDDPVTSNGARLSDKQRLDWPSQGGWSGTAPQWFRCCKMLYESTCPASQ